MIAIGHRGAAGYAPENTLKSVSRALELGVPWVEVDVYVVEDHLVVFHDERLERTTDGHGYVRDRSFAYLRTLDAGEGERIPTLDEVFDLVGRRAGINIELKGPGTAGSVAGRIAGLIGQGWGYDRIVVSSFDRTALAAMKALDPRIRLGGLLSRIPHDDAACGERLGLWSIHPSIRFIDRALVDDAHRRGLQVWAYTANTHEDIARMAALGVDGLFSDYPDRVMRYAGD